MPKTKLSSFDFPAACTRMLCLAGATKAPSRSRHPWLLETVAGTLGCTPYDNWLACRFEDVNRAKGLVKVGHLNQFSGKWNWHFGEPTAADMLGLQYHLASVALPPDDALEMMAHYKAEADLLGDVPMDLCLSYQYRDASNYKVTGEANFRGGLHGMWEPMIQLQAALLLFDRSEGHPSFIPGQVGLKDLQDSFAGCDSHWDPESDTPWHELLSLDPIPEGSAQVYDARDFGDFVKSLLDASVAQGWNESYLPEFHPVMAARFESQQRKRLSESIA